MQKAPTKTQEMEIQNNWLPQAAPSHLEFEGTKRASSKPAVEIPDCPWMSGNIPGRVTGLLRAPGESPSLGIAQGCGCDVRPCKGWHELLQC